MGRVVGKPVDPKLFTELQQGVTQSRWRRGWDSNPRWACTHGGFQDRCLKPLGHPSRRARLLPAASREFRLSKAANRLPSTRTCEGRGSTERQSHWKQSAKINQAPQNAETASNLVPAWISKAGPGLPYPTKAGYRCSSMDLGIWLRILKKLKCVA